MATVLIASDSAAVREDVKSVLGSGDEALELSSGARVAWVVGEHDPDLVVLDMQNGNMGAMATALELRLEESADRLPHATVLMLLDRRADVHLARRSSAEGWVVKPLDPIRLRRAVRQLLDGGEFHDASYQPVPA